MWRANTSNLLHEATEREETTVNDRRGAISKNYARQLYEVLVPYSLSHHQVVGARLSDIISQSLELDEQCSKQVANLRWTTIDPSHFTNAFNPRIMEVERGQTPPSPEQMVELVLAPSLVKWGKSSGEDFDVRTMLLKMEVAVQQPPKVSTGASSYAPGASRRESRT
jgi:hypothetical protein